MLLPFVSVDIFASINAKSKRICARSSWESWLNRLSLEISQQTLLDPNPDFSRSADKCVACNHSLAVPCQQYQHDAVMLSCYRFPWALPTPQSQSQVRHHISAARILRHKSAKGNWGPRCPRPMGGGRCNHKLQADESPRQSNRFINSSKKSEIASHQLLTIPLNGS